MDCEGRAVDDRLQRDSFPGRAFRICDGVQQDRVGAVEESLRGRFEIRGCWVEYGQIEIRFHEAQDAVRFDDGVLRGGENLADAGHGLSEVALLGADPPGVIGAGNQEARSIGLAGAVFFLRYSEGMIGRGAVARLPVGGADAVSVLSDLEGGPVEARQRGDKTGDDAGLADAAGVSADDENGHSR